MLKVAALNVSIGAVAIIRDVSLELGAGEMCGLIGRNGAGKTTLMRALMGALPASGTAELAGTDLLRTPPHCRVAHGIGYMPEDRRLVPEFTVEQNIRLPSWAVKLSGVDERLDWIFTIIPEVARVRDRRALELSVGAGDRASPRRSFGEPQRASGHGVALRIKRGPCRGLARARLPDRARRGDKSVIWLTVRASSCPKSP